MSVQCPKCSTAMEAVEFSGITVERCVACKGIWFDGTAHRDLKKIKGSEAIDTGSAEVGKEFDKMTGVACPVCGVAMDRKPDTYQPHIHFDVCPVSHGVFFDAGEFRDFVKEDFGDFFRDLLVKNPKN